MTALAKVTLGAGLVAGLTGRTDGDHRTPEALEAQRKAPKPSNPAQDAFEETNPVDATPGASCECPQNP
jgi:hypothetical protein